MKLSIPDIGDTLLLTANWTFPLYLEHRNGETLAAFLSAIPALNYDYKKGDDCRTLHYRSEKTLSDKLLGQIHTSKSAECTYVCPDCNAELPKITLLGHTCPSCKRKLSRIHHQYKNSPVDVPFDVLGSRSAKLVRETGTLRGLEVTIPVDSVLTVDRIYIRKGAKDFSSVSFLITDSHVSDLMGKDGSRCFGRKGFRFWATLDDVNRMEAEVQKAVPKVRDKWELWVNDYNYNTYASRATAMKNLGDSERHNSYTRSQKSSVTTYPNGGMVVTQASSPPVIRIKKNGTVIVESVFNEVTNKYDRTNVI
jgi:hypothetical protein